MLTLAIRDAMTLQPGQSVTIDASRFIKAIVLLALDMHLAVSRRLMADGMPMAPIW